MIYNACAGYGYEIEPHIDNENFSISSLKEDDIVIAYQRQHTIGFKGSKEYYFTEFLVDLLAKIKLEFNDYITITDTYLEQYIKQQSNIPASEQLHLIMRSKLALESAKLLKTLKTRLNKTYSDKHSQIAQFIIAACIEDNKLDLHTLRVILNIFSHFKLSNELFREALSTFIDNPDDIINLLTSSKSKSKRSNSPTLEKRAELKIDRTKFAKIKEKTHEIHNVLNEIFTNDQSATIHIPEPIQDSMLSKNIQTIVKTLLTQETWTQKDLMKLINQVGSEVMLNPVIDQINEWSEETYGDFLLEENYNSYTINADVANLINTP